MTLDELTLIEDALDMHMRNMSKAEFVNCVKASAQESNAQAWDRALALINQYGSCRKALNHIYAQIDLARAEYFPA
jgi:hypothetical protein